MVWACNKGIILSWFPFGNNTLLASVSAAYMQSPPAFAPNPPFFNPLWAAEVSRSA
jgi:hypothetical protein